MSPREFLNLIKEAYGCQLPAHACHLIEEAGGRQFYDCWLIDWDLKFSVPMPADLAKIARAELGYAVGIPDMFSYALARFDKQPAATQAHLKGRFGLYLDVMRRYSEERWKEIETWDAHSWAGS